MKFTFILFFTVLLLSCRTRPPVREVILPVIPEQTAQGMAGELRSLVEAGVPSSLRSAVELTGDRSIQGRALNAAAITLLRLLYSDLPQKLPPADPPPAHEYTRILQDVDRGVYVSPRASSQDYLEYALPCLALLQETRPPRLAAALPDLRRAMDMRPAASVLAPYFLGLFLERSAAGDEREQYMEEAEAAYRLAWGVSGECYPAALGLARVMEAQGRTDEAEALLSGMAARAPELRVLKRQLALLYYHNQAWAEADALLAELIVQDGRDRELLLLRARALVELDQFFPAQGPLDLYGAADPQNRLYLFLQARVQAEGYRNIDAALSFLRTILLNSPRDEEAALYAVEMLLESASADDRAEGREILGRFLETEDAVSAAVARLALQDAAGREAWEEAKRYLGRVLADHRGFQELLAAYTVERGLGNRRAALAAAKELYERDPSNVEGAAAYITALMEGGRREEAGRMIEDGLASVPSGAMKSQYYYLRSRLWVSEERVLADLRTSLFEDPRNLYALIALFEIYRDHRNEQRAMFYLKQALALAPDNPELRRYQGEAGSRD
ncbi:MAG: hypothetical protein LBD08_02545 [Treponema sp.]|nr:hypothetical protein [Treponema sp.]